MVLDVPGDDEGERAHRERMVARDTLPFPRLFRQVPEQVDRGRANGAEFIDVVPQAERVGVACCTASSCSKLGSGLSNPRANQSARNASTRSVSLKWLTTSNTLHLPGA